MHEFIAFWNGAPYVIDADAWIGLAGLTPWVNRGICLMVAPYQLVMSLFFIATVVDLIKLGIFTMVDLIKLRLWRKALPSSELANFENATADTVTKSKAEAAKMHEEKAVFNEGKENDQSNSSESEELSTDDVATDSGQATSSSPDTTPPAANAEPLSDFPDMLTEIAGVLHTEDGSSNLAMQAELVEDCSMASEKLTKETTKQCPPLEHSSFHERVAKVVEQTPGTWKIYDREYDLTAFMDKHPGGKWALQLAQNSDCTVLFESYHVMILRERLEKMMKPYEVTPASGAPPAGAPLLPPDDEMYAELKQMARDYFKGKKNTLGGLPHKLNWERGIWFLAMLFLSWYFNYRLLFHGETLGLILTPVCHWLCGGGLAHEAGHFAAFSNPRWNWVAGILGGCPLVFNFHAWMIQHTVQHHQFTNTYADVDLFHFLPLVRTSREHTKWDWIYKYQWWLVFFLIPTTSGHLNFAVPLDLLLERPVFVGPIGDHEMSMQEKHVLRYGQCEHLRSIMRVFRWPMLLEISLVVAWWVYMSCVVGAFKAFMYYTLMMMTASWFFIVNTQGAHLNEGTMSNVQGNSKLDRAGINSNGKEMMLQGFDGKDSFQNSTFTSSNLLLGRWVREQIAYTVDFCPQSRFWFYFSCGLSMQTFHHVMPGISHIHLFHMYPEFKRICKKHGVEVREQTSFFNFCSGFANWLMDLSIEDSVYAQRDQLDWANETKRKTE